MQFCHEASLRPNSSPLKISCLEDHMKPFFFGELPILRGEVLNFKGVITSCVSPFGAMTFGHLITFRAVFSNKKHARLETVWSEK